MTARELIRWQARHERRATPGWARGGTAALAAGGALALAVASSGAAAQASHVWLAGALAVFAVAFLRVPFHLYWRADAGLLAQLPIAGDALFALAAWRSARAAAWTTVAVAVGAIPLAWLAPDLVWRHAAMAGALGAAAAGLVPAIALWGATLVATSDGGTSSGMRIAAAIATASPTGAARAATSARPPAPSALLGALPGVGATAVIVLAVIEAAWLTGGRPAASPALALGGLAAGSAVAWLAARQLVPAHMGTILRDVSALDRQRLATLELRPPTGLESAIARRLGAAAVVYRKDARLMRRRYPMAFALGALAFALLLGIGVARPAAPAPWLGGVLGATLAYAAVLARRLGRPPIELPRLSRALPIAPAAFTRARVAWLAAWWLVFIGAPGAFAVARVYAR